MMSINEIINSQNVGEGNRREQREHKSPPAVAFSL